MKFKTSRNKICESSKICPYVVAVGDLTKDNCLFDVDEESISSKLEVYLVLGEYKLKIRTNSILDGVEYCFKSCVALNCGFSPECKHVWSFVQYFCYKNVSIGKPYTVATKLLQSLAVKSCS